MNIHNSVQLIFPPLTWIEIDRDIPCAFLQLYPNFKRVTGTLQLLTALLLFQRLKIEGFEVHEIPLGGGWREIWLTQISEEPIQTERQGKRDWSLWEYRSSKYERNLETALDRLDDYSWAHRMYCQAS